MSRKLSTLPRREKASVIPNAMASSLFLNQNAVIRFWTTSKQQTNHEIKASWHSKHYGIYMYMYICIVMWFIKYHNESHAHLSKIRFRRQRSVDQSALRARWRSCPETRIRARTRLNQTLPGTRNRSGQLQALYSANMHVHDITQWPVDILESTQFCKFCEILQKL